jgi:hypothetical protein
VTRRPLILAGALVLAGCVATGAALWATAGSGGPLPGGPLGCPGGSCGSTLLAIPVDVGKPFTYEFWIVVNRGPRAAVLDRVRVLHKSRGFRILGYAVRHVPRIPYTTEDEFPPQHGGPLEPISGFRVLPYGGRRREGQLVVGLLIPRKGVYRFDELAIWYHVGSKRFRAVIETSFVACGPKSAYAHCPEGARTPLPVE